MSNPTEFKTTDGKSFATLKEADLYQNRLNADLELRELIAAACPGYSDQDRGEVFNMIIENDVRILEILKLRLSL